MDRSELGLDALRADIARRLRPVLRGWPEAEAAALVERIAHLELKYRD